jgi:hypothetical protein
MFGLGPSGGTLNIAEGRERLDLTAHDVWVGYFAIGGNGSFDDVERWISSGRDVPRREHNLLAQALNDRFCVRGLDHPVGYRESP